MRKIVFVLSLVLAACAQKPANEHQSHSEGHGAHHKFKSAEEWAKVFDDPARDEWQKPDAVIKALKLPKKAVVADLGAGTGYFAIRIAKSIPQGRVIAADIEQSMVDHMNERALAEGVKNLVAIKASEDSSNITEPCDLILVVDTYHHISNREDYFKRLRQHLKKSGRIAIIDFHEKSPYGPKLEHRVLQPQLVAEMKKAGYKVAGEHKILPHQYFVVFK